LRDSPLWNPHNALSDSDMNYARSKLTKGIILLRFELIKPTKVLIAADQARDPKRFDDLQTMIRDTLGWERKRAATHA
jgi:hypothetical protein